jgi:hypothetical protein
MGLEKKISRLVYKQHGIPRWDSVHGDQRTTLKENAPGWSINRMSSLDGILSTGIREPR